MSDVLGRDFGIFEVGIFSCFGLPQIWVGIFGSGFYFSFRFGSGFWEIPTQLGRDFTLRPGLPGSHTVTGAAIHSERVGPLKGLHYLWDLCEMLVS